MLATLTLRKAAQAEEIARLIMQSHVERRVFALTGDLGAGKTTLIKGFCAALGVADRPSSPSFSIVNEYRTTDGGIVYHFDLYRLKNAEELDGIGFDEYLYSGAHCFIEWPELALDRLPPGAMELSIVADGKGVRTIRMAEL